MDNISERENSIESSAGGGIIIQSNTIHIKNTLMQNNTSKFNGGALTVEYCRDITLDKVEQISNSAYYGAGSYIYTVDNILI